jgi:hypothetical protein
MSTSTLARTVRVPVPVHEPLIAGGRYDYADAFEVQLDESDARSAEEFARCALEDAPSLVRGVVWFAHRYLLRLRLGPRSSPDHVFGWKIRTSEPDMLCLEAQSPLLGRGVIVGRRPDRARTVITTYVFFARPAVARVLWTIAGPLHRQVAVYLLEYAAAQAQPADDLARVY